MGIVQKENEYIHPLVSRIMRIWDIPVGNLCRAHLLGEHRELHAIWVIITQSKKGYARHPETLRWKGKLPALHARHSEEVREMIRRGYTHRSPLDKTRIKGLDRQTEYIDTVSSQTKLLRNKRCACNTLE